MIFRFASPWFLSLLLLLPLLAAWPLLTKGRRPSALRYADVSLVTRYWFLRRWRHLNN